MCNGSFSKFTSEIFWEVFRRFSFTTIQNIGITRVGFLIQFTMACRVKHCTSRTALIDLASRIWKTLNLNNLIYQREILDQVDYFDTHSLFLSYELNFAVLKHNLTTTVWDSFSTRSPRKEKKNSFFDWTGSQWIVEWRRLSVREEDEWSVMNWIDPHHDSCSSPHGGVR